MYATFAIFADATVHLKQWLREEVGWGCYYVGRRGAGGGAGGCHPVFVIRISCQFLPKCPVKLTKTERCSITRLERC